MKDTNKALLTGLATALMLSACGSGNTPPTSQSASTGSELDGSLQIVSLNVVAKPGGRIDLKIHAEPRTQVSVETDGVALDGAGSTISQITDDHGFASWSWVLSPGYKADLVPIIVTADYPGHDQKVMRQLAVVDLKDYPSFMAQLASLTASVEPGGSATISIKTEPKASVDVQAQGIATTNPNLTANDNGWASFTFKVDNTYEADTVPIIVTVKKGDQERKLACEVRVNSLVCNDEGRRL